MKEQLQNIIRKLMIANGTKQWELNDAITVKLTPHTWPLFIWGLQVSPKKQLFVKTIDQIGGHPETFWHELKETDVNADKVIAAIYQRVAIVYKDVNQDIEMQMERDREQDHFVSEVFERENGY